MTMETEKSHSLPPASCKPIVQFQSKHEGLVQGQEKTDVPAQQPGTKNEFSLPLPFCSLLAFSRLADTHPHWGRTQAALLRLLIQMLVFLGSALTNTPRNNA